MATYQATFVIETKRDAYAVEQVLDRLYNSLREESWTHRSESAQSTDMLAEFDELRNAAQRHAPGQLTVTYEPEDGAFEKDSQ